MSGRVADPPTVGRDRTPSEESRDVIARARGFPLDGDKTPDSGFQHGFPPVRAVGPGYRCEVAAHGHRGCCVFNLVRSLFMNNSRRHSDDDFELRGKSVATRIPIGRRDASSTNVDDDERRSRRRPMLPPPPRVR